MTTSLRRTRPLRKRLLERLPYVKKVDAWRGAMFLSEVASLYGAFLLLEHDWWLATGSILIGLSLRLYSGGYR